MSFHRLALLGFCLLPAMGLGPRADHPNFLATFTYSCDASNPAPRVRTKYFAAGNPRQRPANSGVEVFEHGTTPARHYVVVGEVSVLASGARTSPIELTDWAKRGARKLGGDAIVDVAVDDAGSVVPKAGDVGLLYLTANVVRWE